MFGWLECHIVNNEGKIFCSIYRHYNCSGSFPVGNQNFKLETVKAHKQYQLQFDATYVLLHCKPGTVAHKMLMKLINQKIINKLSENPFQI